MRWKAPLFAGIAVVGFFAIVEIALWAAGVRTLLAERDPFHGFSERIRVFEADAAAGVWRTPRRAVLHSFNAQQFRIEKPANGFRVFILGGSSAYGFPWGASVAFGSPLERALASAYPDRAVEVVNAAAMSYGSHRLRILVREILEHEPDALVVYGGHNEFVERRFYRDAIGRTPRLDAASLVLHRSRLFSTMTRGYRALTAAREPTHPAEGATAASLLGLDVSREHSVDVSAGEKAEAHRLFEENLRDLLDRARAAGVPVYLCTVPSNVRGWRPNQSLFAPGTSAEARRAAEAAVESATAALEAGRAADALSALDDARRLAPEHAAIEFLRATALDRLGRFEEAAPAYARARDLDASPTRADGEILEAIRRAGARPGVVLVDVERAFREAAEHGLVGYDLIQDYVHPNRTGHALIALELWRAMLERGEAGPRRVPSEDAFWGAVGGAPDAGTPEDEAKVPALVYNLAVILENQGRIEDAMASYREARALGASHWVEASASLGRLLLLRERPEEAAVEFEAALSRDPAHVKSLVGLAECLRRAGRREPAAEALLRATRADAGNAYAWNRLGVVLSESGREREAEHAFRRAVSLEPGNAGYVTDLAFALLFQHRHREAEAAFRESLEVAPHDRRAWNGLAAVRLEAGDLAEAERIFRESLRADPSDRGASAGLREIDRRQGR